MDFVLRPWQFFIVILVDWVSREQQKVIEFYQLQVETLMKTQGKKRLLLTDDCATLVSRLRNPGHPVTISGTSPQRIGRNLVAISHERPDFQRTYVSIQYFDRTGFT